MEYWNCYTLHFYHYSNTPVLHHSNLLLIPDFRKYLFSRFGGGRWFKGYRLSIPQAFVAFDDNQHARL